MSIDKFGSHIFGKDNQFISSSDENNLIKIIDLSPLTLHYNLVLPFLGKYNQYNHADRAYQLLQDRRISYTFPITNATIINAEYPKKYILLKVNGEKVLNPEGFQLNKGDIISFHQTEDAYLEEFYGELLIKCPVEVTK